MSTKTLLTAQEFAQMSTPETEDYELVEGELIALPGATPLHGKIRQIAVAAWFFGPCAESFGRIATELQP